MLSRPELERAARLAAGEFTGARVDRVRPVGERALVLELKGRGGAGFLHLATDAQTGRLSRLAAMPPAPARASGFAELVRARLRGARLAAIEVSASDRIAYLRFESGTERFSLVLALTGARANLYLLDGADRLLGSLRSLDRTRGDLAGGGHWSEPASRPTQERPDRFAAAPDAEFFAALEAHYSERAAGEERTRLQRDLERALRKARSALAKKRAVLERDATGFDEAERLRRHGELLKGVLPQVRTGQREVRVRDYETGREEVLELDPKQNPQAELQDWFRRARKAERRATRAAASLGELEAREAALADLEARFAAQGESADALAAFAAEPEVAQLLGRFAARAPAAAPEPRARAPFVLGKRELPRRLWPRRYRSGSGLEIWVGRSDEGNDVLSTRLARGNDLFFHLDASPGSHVILRTEGRADPPSEAILEACELAVHFSRHRDAGRVEVLVAPAKGVRKPKGAKPGLVWVTGGKNVTLRRDRARLERILAARIEE